MITEIGLQLYEDVLLVECHVAIAMGRDKYGPKDIEGNESIESEVGMHGVTI